ncbi:MAG: ABC transporter permease [Sphingobacteriaceae bacterium]
MIKNYIKTAWRNLFQNKVYSLINIMGLAIGLTSCLLVATVVIDELSYDKQWKNGKDLYRIISISKMNDMVERTPYSYAALGPELQRDFPQIKGYCRMQVEESSFKFKPGKDAVDTQILSGESSVLEVLDFKILTGNPKKIIKGQDNVVISRKIKDLYFPDSNPIGQSIENVTGNSSRQAIITGVMENMPQNTHLRSDMIVIESSFDRLHLNDMNDMAGLTIMNQYLWLTPQTDKEKFTAQINKWYRSKKKMFFFNESTTFSLQPFTDVYLKSDFNEPGELRGSIRMIYIFTAVSILLLFIACINYINLTTARALKRIREVGIHKILGAEKKQLIMQFLSESLLFFLLAFACANLLYLVCLHPLENYLGHSLAITLFNHAGLYASALGLLLLVCLLTGFYPAFLFSGLKPLNSISGNISGNIAGLALKKSLITLQFVISIIVLIAAVVVNLQLGFLNHKDIGYDKNNLLMVNDVKFGNTGKAFKNELLQLKGVEMASRSQWRSMAMHSMYDDPQNKVSKISVELICGDLDFAATLKIKLNSGRLFNPSLSTDLSRDSIRFPKALISESFTKISQFELDKHFDKAYITPIGVIKPFHSKSLLTKEYPVIIRAYEDLPWGNLFIRIEPGTEKQVIAGLQKLWSQFYPSQALTFNWMTEVLEKQYRAESKLNTLFIFFTLLTIFLACLGLFGLVTFTVEHRVKEIGIRKVLGARVASIVNLIAKDFLKLVLLALVIATPIAWYLMHQWLQDYVYRIVIQWWMFALAGAVSVLIALITICFQAIKAAIANPVKSLRVDR